MNLNFLLFSNTSSLVAPENSDLFVINLYMMAPRLKTSTLEVYGNLSKNISGAMNPGVPHSYFML